MGQLRSTNADDYQHLPQPIGAMAKRFADGFVIPLHSHPRDQLLYAISGVMRLRTEGAAWVVPPDGAAYIPAGTPHAVHIHGRVDMRTLYIDTARTKAEHGAARPDLRVVAVSGLLRELIMALCEEPVDYPSGGRAELLASLIAHELRAAPALALHAPLPTDPRLQRVCAALLADPANRYSLEAWATDAGASARTLARLFQSELGMSFGAWRQRVRFQGALEALSAGASIAQVAHAHGYQSPSAFTSAFGKAMGFAPSQARR